MNASSMFATDFDGTLLRKDQPFCEEDLGALAALRRAGCITVLATGRSPFSLRRRLGRIDLPIDWYILSSGAHILDSEWKLFRTNSLSPEETSTVFEVFSSLGVHDTSIQGTYPDVHFLYYTDREHGADFNRRLSLYSGVSRAVTSVKIPSTEVIGFVSPENAASIITQLKKILPQTFSILKTTSPIDHHTIWIEVFPRGVDKGNACETIRKYHKIDRCKTAAVGNDWNDIHMLRWATASFVVADSPAGLLEEFSPLPHDTQGAVATAVYSWMDTFS